MRARRGARGNPASQLRGLADWPFNHEASKLALSLPALIQPSEAGRLLRKHRQVARGGRWLRAEAHRIAAIAFSGRGGPRPSGQTQLDAYGVEVDMVERPLADVGLGGLVSPSGSKTDAAYSAP